MREDDFLRAGPSGSHGSFIVACTTGPAVESASGDRNLVVMERCVSTRAQAGSAAVGEEGRRRRGSGIGSMSGTGSPPDRGSAVADTTVRFTIQGLPCSVEHTDGEWTVSVASATVARSSDLAQAILEATGHVVSRGEAAAVAARIAAVFETRGTPEATAGAGALDSAAHGI